MFLRERLTLGSQSNAYVKYLVRVYGVMEIPHPVHNSRNSVRRLTCSWVEVLHNAHPKRNIGSAKRGAPSEANSETRYKKKIKKEQSHCAWFSGFPLQQNEKRMALRSSKNQIDGILSRIFIHSHCKARSHNPKGGCACREKKKKGPWFRHTYCV